MAIGFMAIPVSYTHLRKYLTKVDEELEEEFFNTEFERKKKRRELLEQWYNNGYAAELTNGIYMKMCIRDRA